MSYTINKLYIKNFKSIEESFLEELDGELTVLDGPNGFGKTSIFDAIELVLTGSIRRIKEVQISKGNIGFKDHLFARNQDEPVIIKLELLEKESMEKIIIGRKIEIPKLNNIQKRPSDFNASFHELLQISDDLNTDNEVEENFNNKIKIIKDSFKFFNYIEQENSSHFFKEQEVDRMKEISKLFNIEKEERELEKNKKIRDKLRPHLVKQRNELKNLKQQMDLSIDNKEDSKATAYKQVLPDDVHKSEPWDYEVITNFTLEKKNQFYKRIDSYKYLIDNFSQFKKLLMNESIKAVIRNPERIKKLLVISKLIDKKEDITKEYKLKEKLLRLQDILNNRLFVEEAIDYELIYKYFQLPLKKADLIDKIKHLSELKKSNSQVSKSMTTLMSVREKLILDFKSIANHEENICPLCGHAHENYEVLIKEIDEHTKNLKKDMDLSAVVIIEKTDELYEAVFNNLISQIENTIKTFISEENYNIFIHYTESPIDIQKASDFFNKIGIKIASYFYDDTHNFSDLEIKSEKVQKLLEQKIENNITFDLDYYDISKDIFSNVLEKNGKLLESIDSSLFENKKKYLNYQYAIHVDGISKEFNKIKNNLEKIKEYFNSIENIIKIYEKEIQDYRVSMIKKIEIPFYLFSGKIIQNYQRGIGVFIKEDNSRNNLENRIIRFIPHNDTEHDVIHSFSSGQLSATVIAFTLAINKVYSSNALNTILIDDPVQTMDDINMASFIELMRNDFGKNQIILSTHNNNISLFMRYKFSKYGFKTRNINVKEELG